VTRGQAETHKRQQADKNYIGVAGKIFAVLEYFMEKGGKQQAVPFQEVAQALPFAKTTVHRILYSLEKLGYLEKAGDGRAHYRLASKFFELTEPGFHFRRLQAVAKTIMQSLMIRFAETVNLAVLDEGQVAYIDVLQSPSTLRIAATPGERTPAHSTALGKAMLAYLSEDEVHSLIERQPLIKMTPRTITHKAHLLEHLASVREQGIALDLEENLSGVVCAAAPIFDQHGRVVAAISISGPATRMEPKLTHIQDEIRTAGQTISRMLRPRSLSPESPARSQTAAMQNSLPATPGN
jgi:IclR family transcriptional regulator, KDG regulon repressor